MMKLNKAELRGNPHTPFLHRVLSSKNWDKAKDPRKPPLVVMWVCTKCWSAATEAQARKPLAFEILLPHKAKAVCHWRGAESLLPSMNPLQ